MCHEYRLEHLSRFFLVQLIQDNGHCDGKNQIQGDEQKIVSQCIPRNNPGVFGFKQILKVLQPIPGAAEDAVPDVVLFKGQYNT